MQQALQQCQSNNSQAITAAQVLGEGSRFSPVGVLPARSLEARMGKRYQAPEGLYINVSFPTRFDPVCQGAEEKREEGGHVAW
ncbi:hypothetical protein VDS41_11690 [Xanthomonas campestris pv. campestris]|nr:hypothetical protein [Xanthomonas campestris pv. campestris]